MRMQITELITTFFLWQTKFWSISEYSIPGLLMDSVIQKLD